MQKIARPLAGMAFGLAVMLPVSAAAQSFVIPDGCTAYLTVQQRSCVVSHYWTCTAVPGHRWRVDIGENGPSYIARIDDDAQWVESYQPSSPQRARTIFPASDPASVTELLENGLDTFEFSRIGEDGQPQRVVGYDKLLGTQIVIDGETLLATEFSYKISGMNGEEILSGEGTEYVSATHRRFFAGQWTTRRDGEEWSTDRTPVDFAYPGDKEFLSNIPLHDCDLLGLGPVDQKVQAG